MPTQHRFKDSAGFTLVELMGAVAILAIIALIIAQILGATATLTVSNNKHSDANGQARTVFDRMENDFARMVKRSDVDSIFCKATGSNGGGTNDTMYFYSEVDSYFPNSSTFYSGASYSADPYAYKNSVSLVGYRINNDSTSPKYCEMERLAKPLNWDNGPIYSMSSYPASVAFLTYPSPPPTGSQLQSTGSYPYCANPGTGSSYSTAAFNSTLVGAFSNEGTSPSAVGTQSGFFNDCNTANDPFDAAFYHALGTQVCRFEFSFQLKDGTQSSIPVMAPNATNGLPVSNLSASSPPFSTDDSSSGYFAGSRWYDSQNQIGYICLDATPGAAVWHEIGIQDVSAIVVTLAVMDNQGLFLLRRAGTLSTVMPKLQAQLADGVDASVAQTWRTALLPLSGAPSTVATATGLSQSIVSQIRVYQRFFYLSSP